MDEDTLRMNRRGEPRVRPVEEEFEKGKMIPVDLEKLIEKVIVHPQAEEKFIEKVRETIKSYGFDFEVSISEMNEAPLF